MGLDTSHNCWHGPYSAFMRWRVWLHHFLQEEQGLSSPGAVEASLFKAWDEGTYKDQSVPINVLMSHSDCDGEIPPAVCGPLADHLERLMNRFMIERALYDEQRGATQRFIDGLRQAAAAGEVVTFR